MVTLRKRILITGASSGIGRGMAIELAARGRDLALCARRTDRLEELRAELISANPRIRVIVRRLDVNDHPAVFDTFRRFEQELGGLDRIVVNAGMGRGRSIGTGSWDSHRDTAQTNFMGALAQCEAAVEIFRGRGEGHLVTVSSMSAMRGMPKGLTVYGAAKAGLAHLSEGIRADLLGTKIRVTVLYPGYIQSELTDRVKNPPFLVDAETGCRALVKAMEREPRHAFVPAWPWRPIGFAMRHLPLSWVARMV